MSTAFVQLRRVFLFRLFVTCGLFFLQVLVEYDDVEWHRREWISIYKEGLFHLFLVEQGLSWAERKDPFAPSQSKVLWPALVSMQ